MKQNDIFPLYLIIDERREIFITLLLTKWPKQVRARALHAAVRLLRPTDQYPCHATPRGLEHRCLSVRRPTLTNVFTGKYFILEQIYKKNSKCVNTFFV